MSYVNIFTMRTSDRWPSAAVAIAMMAMVAAIAGVALYRIGNNVDAYQKIWATMGGIVGVVIGAIPTYFFTKETTLRNTAIAKDEREASMIANTAAARMWGTLSIDQQKMLEADGAIARWRKLD
jgi:hypothetical protein